MPTNFEKIEVIHVSYPRGVRRQWHHLDRDPLPNEFGESDWVFNTVDKRVWEKVTGVWVERPLGGNNTGGTGFVAITNITPTDPSDNVGNKAYASQLEGDNFQLESCTSSTTEVTVSVLAVTAAGSGLFRPVVDVNGTIATLTRNANTDVWTGTADLTFGGGTPPFIVTATHSAGSTDKATINFEGAPIITDAYFTFAYPAGVTQTEHAAGQTLQFTVVANQDFVEIEILGDAGSAVDAQLPVVNGVFTPTSTKTVEVTVANRGNTPILLPGKVRVRNASGTWSVITLSNEFGPTDGTYVINLNNTRPNIAFPSVTYPSGQWAIKSGDVGTIVNVTETNVDTVSYSSALGQLTISNPTVTGNKSVFWLSGGYNITDHNLNVTAGRTANNTTAQFSTVVWIANDTPTANITVASSRLRSSPAGLPHTVTVTFNQMANLVNLDASKGDFIGSWSPSLTSLVHTRSLVIDDTVIKGAGLFDNLSAFNLAGKPLTAIASGDTYEVGGFSLRTNTITASANSFPIGTAVSDLSSGVNLNAAKIDISISNLNCVFHNAVRDLARASPTDPVEYTITSGGLYSDTGDTVRINSTDIVSLNTTGLMPYSIEEAV
jgi:hypothetical protein